MFNHHRFGGVERHEVNQRREPAHIPLLADGGIHRKHRTHGQKQRQQDAIDKGNMIWCDENAFAAKRLGIASDADAKKDTEKCTEEPK